MIQRQQNALMNVQDESSNNFSNLLEKNQTSFRKYLQQKQVLDIRVLEGKLLKKISQQLSGFVVIISIDNITIQTKIDSQMKWNELRQYEYQVSQIKDIYMFFKLCSIVQGNYVEVSQAILSLTYLMIRCRVGRVRAPR